MRGCRVFPIQNNKVLLMSFCGKGYGGNCKAITEALLVNRPDLDIVWAVNPEFIKTLPNGVRHVKYNSLRYLYELATAKVWVDDYRKSRAIIKRKGQFYIQTWHGCYALKKIEKDAEGSLSHDYIAGAKHDSKMIDLFVSGCTFFSNTILRAFWYDGEILECGSPRLDSLFRQKQDIRDTVRDMYGILQNQHIVLYAPTFRAGFGMDSYSLDFMRLIETLRACNGDDWVILVRLHPNIIKKAELIDYSDSIINASYYADLNDLIITSDIVITDYSSLMFEAAMIGKPVFLFATDIEDYKKDRGFYFELDKLPFPLAQSNEELQKIIKVFNAEEYSNKTKKFFDKLHSFESGRASREVAMRICEVIESR